MACGFGILALGCVLPAGMFALGVVLPAGMFALGVVLPAGIFALGVVLPAGMFALAAPVVLPPLAEVEPWPAALPLVPPADAPAPPPPPACAHNGAMVSATPNKKSRAIRLSRGDKI
ncbi:MAG TPA: hypothetical protein VHY09_01480 [Candidatus Methylacidiphilales bacterium]|nr:hypothetical protein [Candidatus Methylacidiphilales bacterium]